MWLNGIPHRIHKLNSDSPRSLAKNRNLRETLHAITSLSATEIIASGIDDQGSIDALHILPETITLAMICDR